MAKPHFLERASLPLIVTLRAQGTQRVVGRASKPSPLPFKSDRTTTPNSASMLSGSATARDQLNRFKAQTAHAGIDRVHGLRHHDAQACDAELTG